jgi:hypothetical protein
MQKFLSLNLWAVFLPQFAFDYELESGKSSWSLTHTIMTPSFTFVHAGLYGVRGTYSDCFRNMWSKLRPWAIPSAVHLAVAHKLLGFVQDELKHNPGHSLLNSAPESSLSYRQSETWHGNDYLTRDLGNSAVVVDRDGLSLLQTAVLCSSNEPDSHRSAVVCFLSGISPRLKDQDMLYAIEHVPKADFKALLLQFPPGPLQLRSSVLFHSYRMETALLAEPQIFGPLWAVACRKAADNDTAEMLDVLLRRGENINGICGPYGTVLHAALAKHILGRGGNPEKLLSLLIQHGADPNSPGPDGNALEFVWKLANTVRDTNFIFARRYAPLIRYLIDRGAINRRTDPNGRVPSLESMLTFGTTMCLYRCGQELYVHERLLSGNMEEFHEDYRRAYDIHVRPRLPSA